MTKKEFEAFVWQEVSAAPEEWRKGQSVFNVIDRHFGVARAVQFEDGIDCFYNDKNIQPFIDAAYKRLFKEDEK